jgi:YkoY family integral membrane protein
VDVHVTDFVTIGLLVILEGLLSADNALVLAVLVLGLPRRQQRQALRYGIGGAFAFRILAILTAVHLIRLGWVKLAGAIYLLYLSYKHFFRSGDVSERRTIRPARAWLGLSPFWATVVKVELTDIVFAIDSIIVAVAMSPKLWVVVTGGILGVIAMRLVIGQFLSIIERYPGLVDGAFIIIAWVGIKLIIEYGHQRHLLPFAVPTWFSLSLIVVIFAVAYLVARRQAARNPERRAPADPAQTLLSDEPDSREIRRAQ